MNENKSNVSELVMLIGVPASGKSTRAKEYASCGYTVLSSDEKRQGELKALFKYPSNQKELDRLNAGVFEAIKRQTLEELKSGGSVVVDATDLNRRKRMAFLNGLSGVCCHKKCVVFITPREVCLARNAAREGTARVPDEAMKKMLSSFECPGYWEGWDEIEPVVFPEPYSFPFDEAVGFSQDNPHHTLTLFEHLDAARSYAVRNGYPENLQRVAFYHDIGKLYVKGFKNGRGEDTPFAHFYGHENYGAYLFLTEMCCGRSVGDDEFRKILYDTALINCHMRPLNAWSASQTARSKDISMFGEGFVADIELINKADAAAH